MVRISLSELERLTYELLKAAGLSAEHAGVVADVFMRATYRGVGHHDIYELPGRIDQLLKGGINAKPAIKRLHKYAALENYDGDNGLGELCGMFIMRRAEKLADEHGIGLCAIRNTRHILASSPYVEAAAQDGYIGYIVTRGAPTMGAPGRKEKVIGTSPMGYAVPTDKGYPLMFDACLAYASNGVLSDKAQAGERVPAHWGLDADGNPTDDPAAMSLPKGGTRLPIGGHKGFGLTILGEILTGLLSEGQLIDEPQPGTGEVGVPSHTAVCIKADGLLGREGLARRTSELIGRMEARAPGLIVPGKRSSESRVGILSRGGIDVPKGLIDKLNERASLLDVTPLTG
ncbi:Ldh family oxidoreductase [Paenibacillus doosanensis]|uniref:Ldh family oxidoreductase n=1 Tax=Paenibacillus TaxID=44249 RepID=UPI00201D9349|nr:MULTISPECIES: Ldh family oxidoreductase [Paenibacillus]MCS7460304.1 Ldh family oxidoreductase [Paenibacillus doosanensis]